MRAFSAALLLSLSSAPLTAFGQLSFGGHPVGMDRSVGLSQPPLVVMPEVDAEALKARDEEQAALGIKGPFKFGFNHATDLSSENSGIWQTLSNGDRVWRLSIQCPGAYSINFEFHDFVIPDGAQVFVYNELGEVLGGYEAASNPGRTELGVTPLGGDKITIEYVEPARVAGQGRLRVGQVTHAYRDILGATKALNESGSCNNNVICPVGDPWRDQIRSVAMIVVQGDGICTGTLLNNCAEDGTPYFLTANHCLGSPNNWVFRFNWNSPTCTPTANGSYNTISGAQLLANSAGSDVALLQLNTTPPPLHHVYYSGWDKGTTAATSATCIHHPSGDIKKISFENQAVSSGNYSGAQCWRVSAWDDGTTEPGSSGSGLWNQNGLLVGQLYGGQADCDVNINDYFGKFSVSYPLLDEWLGTCGNTLQGYDPAVTAVDEAASGPSMLLTPNPSSGTVNVMLPNLGKNVVELRVVDAVGRVILSGSVAAGTPWTALDLSGHPNGLYLVQASSAGVRVVERLVLNH
ncbi:MAG: trypsin-like peptidase domain-containing protein [Flavobacteriales bacterium]|nr:trypsin-like peptidase domain-containing protein [Flavobacteriales bacterium]